MAVGDCSIYYNSRQEFNFEEAVNFFEKAGFHLKHPETQEIITVDQEGESYAITYEKLSHNILNEIRSRVKLWQDSDWYLFCTFTLLNNRFEFSIAFHAFFYDKDIEESAKIVVDFFFTQLSHKNIIGFYDDKFGQTEDVIYWDEFFLNTDRIAMVLPDILCLKKDKLMKINADISNYTKKEINDYILLIKD